MGLSRMAVAEARTRLRGLGATEPVAEDDGWLSRAARTPKAKLGSLLYTATLRRERDAGQSTLARLLPRPAAVGVAAPRGA